MWIGLILTVLGLSLWWLTLLVNSSICNIRVIIDAILNPPIVSKKFLKSNKKATNKMQLALCKMLIPRGG